MWRDLKANLWVSVLGLTAPILLFSEVFPFPVVLLSLGSAVSSTVLRVCRCGVAGTPVLPLLGLITPTVLMAMPVWRSGGDPLEEACFFSLGLVGYALAAAVSLVRQRGFEQVGLGLGLLVFLVNGMLDTPIWLNKPHVIPLFFMGLLLAAGGGKTSWNTGVETVYRWVGPNLIWLAAWILVSAIGILLLAWSVIISLIFACAGGMAAGGWVRLKGIVT